MTEDYTTTAGWPLLATIVRARRKRLGLTQLDLTTSGPSITTVQTIESGNPVAARTLRKLDDALNWPSATARTIVFANDSAALEQWEDFLTYCVHEVSISDRYTTIHDALLARHTQEHREPRESYDELFVRELGHLNVALAEADYVFSYISNKHYTLDDVGYFDRLYEILNEVRATLQEWGRRHEKRVEHNGLDGKNDS